MTIAGAEEIVVNFLELCAKLIPNLRNISEISQFLTYFGHFQEYCEI